MPQTIIDLLKKGAQANQGDKFRQGNLILLPADTDLVVSGDIHGHTRNFERLVTFADLQNNLHRHLLLQEIIHGGPEDSQGGCLSYRLLFDVIDYKLSFPDRVHIIMGNHDTALISGGEVMKNGREMNRAMRCALNREFPDAAAEIESAIKQFLFSQPLALRTQNRIWASHSLPDDRYIDEFDPEIFDRPIRDSDMVKPGPVYILTWGRRHNLQTLKTLSKLFDADTFILGHQPQQQGWSQPAENLIIIASDHNHGCLLPISTVKPYTVTEITDSIVPLASIP